MSHLLIGAIIAAGFFLLLNKIQKHDMRLTWWQWILTILGFFYATFVFELINSFLYEGAPRAALVMGIITGFIAVVWGVLLGRFFFFKKIGK
jgi:phosphate/sulfate permease